MKHDVQGREHSNWVMATDMDDEQIWRAIQKDLTDESLLVSLARQLPFGKWLARDHHARWLVVADEHLVREWIGVLPTRRTGSGDSGPSPESQRASRGGPDWLKARNERHFL